MKKCKKVLRIGFDSSKEGPRYTKCNIKDLSSLQIIVTDKIKINQKKAPKMGIFENMGVFGGHSWFFQEQYWVQCT